MAKARIARKIIGFIRKRGRAIPLFKKKDSISQRLTKAHRKLLKAQGTKKAAGRTSLAEKRIKAVKSVRDTLPAFKALKQDKKGLIFDALHFDKNKNNVFRVGGQHIKAKWVLDDISRATGGALTKKTFLGQGSDINVVASRKTGQVVKALRPSVLDHVDIEGAMTRRGNIKTLLAKNKLAPETFTVNTSENTFLVQEMAPKIGGEAFKDNRKIINKLRAAAEKLKMSAKDLNDANIGKLRGRNVVIDAGMFEVHRGITSKDIRRFKKFTIGKKK